VFRSWELELETITAPLQLHLQGTGGTTNRNELANWSATLQRSHWFKKKFAFAAYTCTGFLIECDFRYSISGQDVEPAWYFSPYFYWRPSFQLLGLFPQVHTIWEFVFTQFSRHLTFREFSVPPSAYPVFDFDRFALLWVTELLISVPSFRVNEATLQGKALGSTAMVN